MKILSSDSFIFDGVDTKVISMKIDPDDFWNSRFEIHEKLSTSAEIIDSMSSEQQAALVSKIKRAMAIMHDQVPDWLPDALSMSEDGSTIRVEFNFLAAEIDREVAALDQVTSFDIQSTIENTKKTLNELQSLDDA